MRFPWYRVIWNLLWIPLAYVGVVITAVAIALNKLSWRAGLEYIAEFN